ncbi:hypothetical protein MKX01_013150 [Papaver californicum]|nr:hypothetical protein MKX01_013150 [Papaver californicum]
MAHPHSISGIVGKLVTESEVNCNADKYYKTTAIPHLFTSVKAVNCNADEYYKMYKHHEDLSRAMPHIYNCVKTVEGHGTTSGCIKEWCFILEDKTISCKEKTTYNDETRTICHSVVEGDLMNDYNSKGSDF